MTALLQEAIQAVSRLPEAEQDHLAVSILNAVNHSDSSWDVLFAKSGDMLAAMAAEALEEDRRGETLPLDPTTL